VSWLALVAWPIEPPVGCSDQRAPATLAAGPVRPWAAQLVREHPLGGRCRRSRLARHAGAGGRAAPRSVLPSVRSGPVRRELGRRPVNPENDSNST